MARLAQLKFAMGSSIFIVGFIFAAFLAAIMFIIQLDLIYSVILTVLFILFQYLIGPAIVRMTTRLQYLKAGENPWLESTVKGLADKSGIPVPRLATVPDNTPNAFVFGRTASGATLALHEGASSAALETPAATCGRATKAASPTTATRPKAMRGDSRS